MKKRIIAILACTLIFITSLTGLLACSCDSEEEETPVNEQVLVTPEREFQGVHQYDAPEIADNYFVKNGASEYILVLPEITPAYANKAVEEFNFFYKEAVGGTLKVIHEEAGVTYAHNATQRYISIGDTKLLESTGIAADRTELQQSGLRIKTVDNNVYIYAESERSLLYAVYDFMQIMFNYEIYTVDYWEIDKVDNVLLRNFNVLDIPDCDLVISSWNSLHNKQNPINAERFRTVNDQHFGLILAGDEEYHTGEGYAVRNVHNSLKIVNKNNPIVAAHPEWISTTGDQLCYTAGGSSESFKKMAEHTANILIKNIISNKANYFEKRGITVTSEDVASVCNCAGCRALKEKYGTDSAAVILFCNEVMSNIKEWWNGDTASWEVQPSEEGSWYKRDDFYLYFFAYSAYIKSPAVYDQTAQKYVLSFPELEFDSNVGVFLTTHKINAHYSIYSEVNDEARENFVSWLDISPAQYVWTWNNNFDLTASLYDTYSHFNDEFFQLINSSNLQCLFMEAQPTSSNNTSNRQTGFTALKTYLESEMAWDSSQDYYGLIDKWFNAMYGAAAETMRDMFDEMRLFEHTLYDKCGVMDIASVTTSGATTLAYWSPTELTRWLELFFKAQQINEEVNKERSPELYEAIKKNIDFEFVYPAAMMLNNYKPEQVGEMYYKVVKYFNANSEFFSSGFRFTSGVTLTAEFWETKPMGE